MTSPIHNDDKNYDPDFSQEIKANLDRTDQNNDQNNVGYDSDREIPQLNDREHTQGKKLVFWIIVLVILIIIFFGFVIFAKNYSAYKEQKKNEEAAEIEKKQTNADFGSDRIAKDKEALAAVNAIDNDYPDPDINAASEPAAPAPTYSEPAPTYSAPAPTYSAPAPTYSAPAPTYSAPAPTYSAPAPTYSAPEPEPEPTANRKLDPDMMIAGSSSLSGLNQEQSTSPVSVGFQENQSSNFSKQYQSSGFAASSAIQRNNLSLLLKQGTMIPCVLKTKIVSTYSGQTACQVTKDVYSANGKTLLIERGSSVIGEQTIKVEKGSAKVFVLWSKLDTPKGISLTLDSGAVDNLGSSGINAKVNNHFWQRFGGAILLSVIDDAFKTLDNKNNQTGGVSYNSSSESAKELANTALENSINIPPTATINQGTLINIFVARDVDFTGVYRLVSK